MPRNQAKSERLTHSFIKKLEPENRRIRINDTQQPGLCLLLHPSGRCSFSVRYQTAEGKHSEKSLGSYPTVSVEQARRLAAAERTKVLVDKIDPVETARATRSQGTVKRKRTFAALVDAYLEHTERESNKAARTLSKEKHHLCKNVVPIIGSMAVENIKRKNVRDLLHKVADKASKRPGAKDGKNAANDCLKYLNLVFSFAMDELEWIEANPASGIKKLPVSNVRGRDATEEELRLLWSHWTQRMEHGRPQDWSASAALKFALLTLQRGEEVASSTWDEFDLSAKRWTLPANRKKERREFIVPLSEPALDILREAKRRNPSAEGPFPGRSPGTIRRDALTKCFKRDCNTLNIEDLRPHDLRRTGRTAITDPERLGFPLHIGELVIAHKFGSSILTIYDKNSYVTEKRNALDAWAKEVLNITSAKPAHHSEKFN